MKKVILALLSVILIVACGSPEKKANALIEKEIKKILYHADTYDPVETVLDSAFAPYDDPVVYEKLQEMYGIAGIIEECNNGIKDATRTMSIWDSDYQSAFGKSNYEEAKKDLEDYEDKKKEMEKKAKDIALELKSQVNKKRTFIGFKAQHRYRANNNAGQVVFGQHFFLFDKDITKVVNSYDIDNEEYLAIQVLHKNLFSKTKK